MKYQYIRILFLTILIVDLSCDKESQIQIDDKDSFWGSVENVENNKSILMDNGASVWWEPGDDIRIFCSGEEGKYSSTISSPSTTSSFISETHFSPNDSNRYFAIYPYSDKDSFDGTNAIVTIPHNQYADKDSFDKKAFVMMAESDNHVLGFKNLCGGVKLSVSQDSVYCIVLKGNNGESIAGKVMVCFENGVPVAQKVLEPQKTIELRCPGGKCFEKGKWYYISCLPAILSKGFTVELFKNEGEFPLSGKFSFEQSTSIQRSVWGRVNQIDDSIKYTPVPQDDVIFYNTKNGELASLNYVVFDKYFSSHVKNESSGYNVLVLKKGIEKLPAQCFRDTDITSVMIPSTIKSIGSMAFYGCSELMSISIPESVIAIERNTFDGCTGLKSVYITSIKTWCNIAFDTASSNPLSVASILYANNEVVHDLVIPTDVGVIGANAFYGYRGLTSVTIPESVNTIGRDAFRDCNGLRDVYISSINTWCKTVFVSQMSNPLYGASNLYVNNEVVHDLVIPADVGVVGACSFSGYRGLTSVEIQDGVIAIGDHAFYQCTGLAQLTIPKSVNTIGGGAFYCTGLAQINIPGSVTSIGAYAFSHCTKLMDVCLQEGIKTIEQSAFTDCKGLIQITIPNSVISIGKYAFGNCTGLLSITIPEKVAQIQDHTFQDCTGLKDVDIPEGVTSIGKYVFYGCKALTSVTIPSSVTDIGNSAFSNCSRLAGVTIFASTPPYIGNTVFESNASARKIYVPSESLAEYKVAAGWNEYSSDIVGI